jgi:hypothetical protein
MWTVESGWNDSVCRSWLCSCKPASIGIIVVGFMVRGGGRRACPAKQSGGLPAAGGEGASDQSRSGIVIARTRHFRRSRRAFDVSRRRQGAITAVQLGACLDRASTDAERDAADIFSTTILNTRLANTCPEPSSCFGGQRSPITRMPIWSSSRSMMPLFCVFAYPSPADGKSKHILALQRTLTPLQRFRYPFYQS